MTTVKKRSDDVLCAGDVPILEGDGIEVYGLACHVDKGKGHAYGWLHAIIIASGSDLFFAIDPHSPE